MALRKNHVSVFGVEGDYWRIEQLRYIKKENKIFAVFELFANAEFAASGKSPLDSLDFSFEANNEDMQGDLRVLAYSKVKECILEGAEDC